MLAEMSVLAEMSAQLLRLAVMSAQLLPPAEMSALAPMSRLAVWVDQLVAPFHLALAYWLALVCL